MLLLLTLMVHCAPVYVVCRSSLGRRRGHFHMWRGARRCGRAGVLEGGIPGCDVSFVCTLVGDCERLAEYWVKDRRGAGILCLYHPQPPECAQ